VVKGTHPMEAGIDLSPMKILKESGYGE
jgi:hypothetical protein